VSSIPLCNRDFCGKQRDKIILIALITTWSIPFTWKCHESISHAHRSHNW